jgi:hypothetical protein
MSLFPLNDITFRNWRIELKQTPRSVLEWPRSTYYFGPIIIQVDLIEPFIITGVFVGIDVTDMHEVQFDSIEQRSEFVHMLDQFPDQPPELPIDLEAVRNQVSEKKARDTDSRDREYETGKYKK